VSQTVQEPAPASLVRHLPRRYIALGLIIVAICLLGALVIVRDNAAPPSTSTVETFNGAPSSLISTLASVPTAVYDAVGVGSPSNPLTPMQATGNSRSWYAATGSGDTGSGTGSGSGSGTGTAGDSKAKPVVFFYGAEFAPFAAAERWPLVLALSRFGTFDQLGLMQSSSSTAFADLSTFTFWQAKYSSKYLVLAHVERYSALNPTGGRYEKLETPNAREAASVAAYSSSPTNFALLDVANRWVLNGSSYSPTVLDGLTQSQIAGDLSSATSPLTQALLASANEITATICGADGQVPTSVCASKGVEAADDALKISAPAEEIASH